MINNDLQAAVFFYIEATKLDLITTFTRFNINIKQILRIYAVCFKEHWCIIVLGGNSYV